MAHWRPESASQGVDQFPPGLWRRTAESITVIEQYSQQTNFLANFFFSWCYISCVIPFGGVVDGVVTVKESKNIVICICLHATDVWFKFIKFMQKNQKKCVDAFTFLSLIPGTTTCFSYLSLENLINFFLSILPKVEDWKWNNGKTLQTCHWNKNKCKTKMLFPNKTATNRAFVLRVWCIQSTVYWEKTINIYPTLSLMSGEIKSVNSIQNNIPITNV